MPLTELFFFGRLTCELMASELQVAFYFADDSCNILLPLVLCYCVRSLLMRENPIAAGSGALLAIAGVFEHEVIAIYTLGDLLVALSMPRAIAIYRDRLGDLPDRASADFGRQLRPLRAEAFAYMHQLFDAPKSARLRLCRPRHVYSKPPRMLTDHNERDYFGLQQVRHKCPQMR